MGINKKNTNLHILNNCIFKDELYFIRKHKYIVFTRVLYIIWMEFHAIIQNWWTIKNAQTLFVNRTTTNPFIENRSVTWILKTEWWIVNNKWWSKALRIILCASNMTSSQTSVQNAQARKNKIQWARWFMWTLTTSIFLHFINCFHVMSYQ